MTKKKPLKKEAASPLPQPFLAQPPTRPTRSPLSLQACFHGPCALVKPWPWPWPWSLTVLTCLWAWLGLRYFDLPLSLVLAFCLAKLFLPDSFNSSTALAARSCGLTSVSSSSLPHTLLPTTLKRTRHIRRTILKRFGVGTSASISRLQPLRKALFFLSRAP